MPDLVERDRIRGDGAPERRPAPERQAALDASQVSARVG